MRGPFKKRSAAVLVATAASALVAAAPALAEPDYNTTLNASTTEFKWTNEAGSTGFVVTTPSSIPCKTPGVHDCDHILIKTEVAGGLTVKTEATSPNAADVDLRLFKSNEKGEAKGEVASSGGTNATESVSTNAAAGAYYLAEVDHAINAGGTYAGVATLKPKAGAAPAPGPGAGGGGGGGGQADSAPAVGISRFAASQKSKKLKGFTGSASDDKGISKIELAIVAVKGKKCTEMDAKGKFGKADCPAPAFKLVATGTAKWQLKLKKALKKGSYVLYARAVDSAGQKSAVASQKFKVK
jgi:hypothetical protein